MRKLVYLFVGLMTLSVSLVSCDDSDDDAVAFETTAERDFVDTTKYFGMLTRVEAGKNMADTADAEISVVATDSAYVVDMIVHCFDTSFKIDSLKGPVNIARAGAGYKFYNNLETNMFKNRFAGCISEEGSLSTIFVMKIRSGRSTKTYNFDFKGYRK